ncbi:MAG: hypothetical protein M3246_01065 [Actinomycetota bacterium]|nr:hypothetical protein [Actinomycetota bacterium]
MIRRLQLLEPESRFSMRRVAAVGNRIRDSLLRGNKVIPPVLAVLALLIFTWLAAGAFMGGPGEQGDEEEQVSSQASLAQGPESPENQAPESPTPGVEDRDADSFAKFRSKDPFRDIIPEARETTGADDGGDRNGRGGNGEDRDGRSPNGGDRNDEDRGEDFIDQSFPEDSGGRPGDEGGDAGEGADRDAGSGQDGGVGRGGNGGLFDSGGNLAPWGF